MTDTTISHLDALEAESIHIMREVAAEFERPVLLFSGGKVSIVMLRIAEKAFHPGRIPFPLMHVDTGHNFPEVIEYRDALVLEHGLDLVVASVQKSIDDGRIADPGPTGSRNRQQAVTLLDAIKEHKFDAAFGGGRRDEDKARAMFAAQDRAKMTEDFIAAAKWLKGRTDATGKIGAVGFCFWTRARRPPRV